MKKRKKIADIPDKFIPTKEIITKEYLFELITPMFGGDYEEWQLDEINPVRSQSVKGMLRFWWRTMQSETDCKKLLYKENAIWGGKTIDDNNKKISCQSPVKLFIFNQKNNVETFKAREKNNKFQGVEDDAIPSYVLFPITEKIKNNEQIFYIKKLSFKLQISYPEKFKEDVLNTLKLWCLFGGVGARTRRGTGSLYCEDLLKDFQSENDIKNFINGFQGINEELEYPRIINSILAVHKENATDTSKSWYSLLTSYGDYRQKAGNGRGKGRGKTPGRSYWPEPDSIREITKQSSNRHIPEHPDRNWFPRAVFGLPIQFEFRGDKMDPQGKIILKPETGDRWPSPVILKVIKLPNGNIYNTAIILNQKFPDSLELNELNYTLNYKEMPTNTKNKVMKTNDPLNNRTIYQHLMDALELKEVN